MKGKCNLELDANLDLRIHREPHQKQTLQILKLNYMTGSTLGVDGSHQLGVLVSAKPL